jgi:hypothetical protein
MERKYWLARYTMGPGTLVSQYLLAYSAEEALGIIHMQHDADGLQLPIAIYIVD